MVFFPSPFILTKDASEDDWKDEEVIFESDGKNITVAEKHETSLEEYETIEAYNLVPLVQTFQIWSCFQT